MRAAHLLRKLNPAEWGGTETAIQGLMAGLREQGVRPIVYCPKLEEPSARADPLINAGCEVARFNAFVPVLGLSKARRREMVAVGGNLMSFDLLTSLWREPNLAIIHTHALGRIGGIGLTIAKRRRIPFVVTIHGGVLDLPQKVMEEFNATSPEGWEWGKLFGLLFKSHGLFRDADAIVTCNPKEAALLRERYPQKHILVQPHAVATNLFEQDHRQTARSAFPQTNGKKVLLCVGRIDPIKNQSWLLEQMPSVLGRHPQSLLVLAGACTNETYGCQVQKRIEELGLKSHVLLTGGLPPGDPQLIGLFQIAETVILPSISETFGLVILESWAAGKVPLSSRTSGATALIADADSGFLFDLNVPQQFHRAIDALFDDPAGARQMAARGFEKAHTEFSISALAGRVKNLYKELISEKSCVTS